MAQMCLRLKTAGKRRGLLLRAVRAGDGGSQLVEFAFLLPVLLTLLLGIFWMGRAYNVYQTMTRAAREGARYAVLPSCASCGNSYVDTYTSAGTCLSNPTNVFTSYVSPALSASSLDASKVQSYCQKAQVLDPNSDSSVAQCGVVISFQYPMTLAIPFTSLSASTVNISTNVQMRMENQSVDGSGNPTCP